MLAWVYILDTGGCVAFSSLSAPKAVFITCEIMCIMDLETRFLCCAAEDGSVKLYAVFFLGGRWGNALFIFPIVFKNVWHWWSWCIHCRQWTFNQENLPGIEELIWNMICSNCDKSLCRDAINLDHVKKSKTVRKAHHCLKRGVTVSPFYASVYWCCFLGWETSTPCIKGEVQNRKWTTFRCCL